MRPLRIVQVVLSLDIGGQERLVVRIAHALRARGHEPHVVTLTKGGALRTELGTIPVHEVPRRAGFDPLLYAKLWRALRALGPDVVHTHNAAPLIYGAPAARFARVPRIVHTKHGDFRYPANALRLARTASRFVDAFVPVSAETSAAAARNERPAPRRIHVIENGIPLAAFGRDPSARAAVRAELGIPEGALVVGSVGRLVPDKDYPLLVRAMAPLLDEGIRLVIVGEGGARPAIEAAVTASIPLENRHFVTLTGARHDVPRVLTAFDLFASSSRTEGLPLAVPEAMTSHLPVVATAVGGVPGIVPADAGVLVPHGDEATFTAALDRLLHDGDARERMGDAGRRYALQRFSEDRMVDDYLSLYIRSSGR
jgi:glycosyltransferase involved in cell wall biosynthesis